MSKIQRARNYCFLGLDLRVLCSEAIAESLHSRFRLLSSDAKPTETISLDFQSVPDGSHHCLKRPHEKGRSFYELPAGEACHFETGDQLYFSFQDGLRALGNPGQGSASFSIVESDPVNVFMASHLILTILLVEILKRRACYSMHAAGFTDDGNAVLIAGTSGAGKSTLAVTLLRSGFGYLSDDMVFLRRSPDGPQVLGFPEDVDVGDQTVSFFPELDFLKHSPKNAGWPKKQVRADEVYGAELVSQARPGAIVFPRISGKATSAVRQIGADEAFLELVSNVLLTEPRSCQSHLGILTELVNHVPCYQLQAGRDFDRIPSLIRELLSGSREEVHA
jgi:hypothetical protein